MSASLVYTETGVPFRRPGFLAVRPNPQIFDNGCMEANGLPSRTSILTAAARAFGASEPDASVRNPDWAAGRLIGPAELALIADHPLSTALDRDYRDAIHDPDIYGI